jgi:hypothetical protein
MGLTAKYDEILDDTILRGMVADKPHLSYGGDWRSDGDWIMLVTPAPGYELLLRNPDGYTNANGYVECEVEPIDQLPGGKDAESGNEVVEEFMGPLKGQPVRIVGTWTRDREHNGDVVVFDALQGDKGKTEIHPITSLLGKLPPPNPKTRRFVFLVFSDDSGGLAPTASHQPAISTVIPPHAGENRRGEFRLAVPSGSNIVKVDEHTSKAGSDLIVTTDEKGSFSYVKGLVTSGKPSDGKGFYHLVFDVPALFSLRAYFDSEAYRAIAPLVPMPPECQAIADELQKLQEQYNKKVSQKDDQGEYQKPLDIPGAPELLEEKTKVMQQLHACMDKRKSLRPVLPAAPKPCAGVLFELQKLKEGKRFDPDLRQWVEAPASPAAIAAQEKKLAECLQNNPWPPPGYVSLKSLIESAYP